MLRVVFLASGRSFHATRWANGLAQRGYNVHFISLHELERPLLEDVSFYKLNYKAPFGYFFNYLDLKKLIDQIQPDVVHSHYATGYGFLGALVNKRPFVISAYGSDILLFPEGGGIHKYFLRWVLNRSDMVLATSRLLSSATKGYLRKTVPIEKIPFGIDFNKFSPASNLRLGSETIHIGIVKKLERVYGIDVFLNGLKILIDRVETPLKVTIVGSGSQSEYLKSLAISLNLGFVEFLGPVTNDEVPGILRTFDIFVVPSRSESFGVAALEACGCAIPVIASDVGGLPEIVVDGVNGLLFPVGDSAALADALEFLVRSPDARMQYGQAGFDLTRKLYDWDKSLDCLSKVYKKVTR